MPLRAAVTMMRPLLPISPRLDVCNVGFVLSTRSVAPVVRVRLAKVNWALFTPVAPGVAVIVPMPVFSVTAPRDSVELN